MLWIFMNFFPRQIDFAVGANYVFISWLDSSREMSYFLRVFICLNTMYQE